MKLKSLLILTMPLLLLSACQSTSHRRSAHYRTKVVKKVVYVHHRKPNYKKPKPLPAVANLKPKHKKAGMPQYRVINKPVVVLTFHNNHNEDAGTQMTKYLNSIVNLDQYHVQVSATGSTTYVTLRQLSANNNY